MSLQQLIIRDSSERAMSGNLSVPIQTQLETNLSPNITTRPKENIGERKSKTHLPKQEKVIKLPILR